MRLAGILALALLLPAAAVRVRTPASAGGELKMGRYTGDIRFDSGQRLAVVLDPFIVQPDDVTQFPKLNAIFRLGLGGYNSSEYVTADFADIQYDFDTGILTFDDADSDFVLSAQVYKVNGGTEIRGDVWVRSVASRGHLRLILPSDEPGDDDDGGGTDEPDGGGGMGGTDEPSSLDRSSGTSTGTGTNTEPLAPLLSGRYTGTCDGQTAALQVQTAKGLEGAEAAENSLHGYAVTARLALANRFLCGDGLDGGSSQAAPLCVYKHYPTASYNFYKTMLILGSETDRDTCALVNGHLSCQVRLTDRTLSCDLQHEGDAPSSMAMFYERKYAVVPTDDQAAELPAYDPPQNADLNAALSGDFNGYLHHEASDRYQSVQTRVFALNSTPNPHNENNVFVTASFNFFFDGDASSAYWSQQTDRIPFYVRPGFTLGSASGDGFLEVTDWGMGYIAGVWYSHHFGRIGTIQLVKAAMPPLSSEAKRVYSPLGDFQGPSSASQAFRRWHFNTAMPLPPAGWRNGWLPIIGQAQLMGGTSPRFDLDSGAYDPYTGQIAWITQENGHPNLTTGAAADDHALYLAWPNAPVFGVRLEDAAPVRYEHQ